MKSPPATFYIHYPDCILSLPYSDSKHLRPVFVSTKDYDCIILHYYSKTLEIIIINKKTKRVDYRSLEIPLDRVLSSINVMRDYNRNRLFIFSPDYINWYGDDTRELQNYLKFENPHLLKYYESRYSSEQLVFLSKLGHNYSFSLFVVDIKQLLATSGYYLSKYRLCGTFTPDNKFIDVHFDLSDSYGLSNKIRRGLSRRYSLEKHSTVNKLHIPFLFGHFYLIWQLDSCYLVDPFLLYFPERDIYSMFNVIGRKNNLLDLLITFLPTGSFPFGVLTSYVLLRGKQLYCLYDLSRDDVGDNSSLKFLCVPYSRINDDIRCNSLKCGKYVKLSFVGFSFSDMLLSSDSSLHGSCSLAYSVTEDERRNLLSTSIHVYSQKEIDRFSKSDNVALCLYDSCLYRMELKDGKEET